VQTVIKLLSYDVRDNLFSTSHPSAWRIGQG
jgi:hypothetical protein